MRLEALVETVKPLPIEFEVIDRETGETKIEVLNLKYRPNAYTPRLEEESARAQSTGKAGDMLKAMLIPLIASWDMTHEVAQVDAEGKPVTKDGKQAIKLEVLPITMDSFDDVPLSVLSKILGAVAEDITPSKQSQPSLEGSFS